MGGLCPARSSGCAARILTMGRTRYDLFMRHRRFEGPRFTRDAYRFPGFTAATNSYAPCPQHEID
jgi:hypothetical protein